MVTDQIRKLGRWPRAFTIAAHGDFNGDGKSDLLMLPGTTHDVVIWEMNGTQVVSNAKIGTVNAEGGLEFCRQLRISMATARPTFCC